MTEAHDVFGDANRKSHLAPARFSPAQIAEMIEIAALGNEGDDDGEDE